jgi:hypothetical protein
LFQLVFLEIYVADDDLSPSGYLEFRAITNQKIV